jgi:hypothetical protein
MAFAADLEGMVLQQMHRERKLILQLEINDFGIFIMNFKLTLLFKLNILVTVHISCCTYEIIANNNLRSKLKYSSKKWSF